MQTVNVAVMGHGVVGSGVVEVLLAHEENIAVKAKNKINVKYILDLRDFPGLDYSDRFIKDFDLILKDDSIKVVVEVMGGVHPAYEYALAKENYPRPIGVCLRKLSMMRHEEFLVGTTLSIF